MESNNKQEKHAKAMFRENAKYFLTLKNEFDILSFSKSYCDKNMHVHGDKGEYFILIMELIALDYVKKTGDDYNIVTITETGRLFLSRFSV